MIYGVDVHARYQAGLDIPRLRSEGYSFLVTKASEGTSIPTSSSFTASQFKARYLSWLAEARGQGMIPGLYHWIRAGRGAEQAAFFHGLVVEAGGPKGMLIQLDCEHDATYADVVAWRDEWNRLTDDHPFLLYTGGWWWRPRGWDGKAITPYLWDSHYLTADADTIPDDPAAFASRVPSSWWAPGYGGWPGATVLQFTSQGDAGSLGNNVDLNVFRGSRAELLTLTGDDMSALDPDERQLLGNVERILTGWDDDRDVDGIRYLGHEQDEPVNPNPFRVLRNRLDVIEFKLDALAGPSDEQLLRVLRKLLAELGGATPA